MRDAGKGTRRQGLGVRVEAGWSFSWVGGLLVNPQHPRGAAVRNDPDTVKVDNSGANESDRLWEGCRESRRCSRDTYPESYITKYTSIQRLLASKVDEAGSLPPTFTSRPNRWFSEFCFTLTATLGRGGRQGR